MTIAPLLMVAAYLAVAMIVGYAAVSAAVDTDQPRHWAEVAGLSVVVGLALTGFALFGVSLIGIAPSRGVLAGWGAVAAVAAAGVLWRQGRLLQPTVPTRWGRPDPLAIVGVLAGVVLLAAIANAAAAGTAPGLGDIDEYATWMFKAKLLAAAPLRPVPGPLLDPGLSYSHQDYPLLFPMLVAGTYAAVGGVSETAGKLLLLPTYLGLIGIVYGAVRRHHRRAVAIAVTAVATAGPTVVQKAGTAVPEVLLLACLAGATSLLAEWADRRRTGDLALAGVLAAAAAFTKNEGLAMLPVFAVAAVVASGRRPTWRAWLTGSLVVAALIVPWVIYRRGLPKTHEDYGGRLADVFGGVGRLPHVLAGVGSYMVDIGSAGAVWIVLAVSAVAGWRAWRSADTRAVWVVLLGQLSLYVAVYLVTPWSVDVLLPMITARLLAQAAPVAGVLIGLHLRPGRADV